MSGPRRTLANGALAALVWAIAGCVSPEAQAPVPPQPAPTAAVVAAPAPEPAAPPLEDQPPVAAPTERVAVAPLGEAAAPPAPPSPENPTSEAPEAVSAVPAGNPLGSATPERAVLAEPVTAALAPAVSAAPETPPPADAPVVSPQGSATLEGTVLAEPVTAALVPPAAAATSPPAAPAVSPQGSATLEGTVLAEPVTAALVPPAAPATSPPAAPAVNPEGVATLEGTVLAEPATPAPVPAAPQAPAGAVILAAIPSPVPIPEPKPEPDPRFDEFVRDFRPEALRAGITAETYDRAMSGIVVNRRVTELDASQPEFVRPIWEYLAGALSDQRVSGGREKLAAEPGLFERLEGIYGVPREVLTALWGQESAYGRLLGTFNPFEVLATLAYDGRRQEFGRRELLAALKIAQAEGLDPKEMKSSWAGAFGHTQFMPTTFLELAVDGDGDGKRDLWNSYADALASAANYLKRAGWRAGQSWGEEVRLPESFPFEQADPEIKKSQREWAALGVRTAAGRELPATDEPVALFMPAGARGPAFLLGGNFNAIKRYNNADAYALAIALLSDRLKGEEGVIGVWPRDERPLNRGQRVALQEGLTALGFPTGNPDGVLGRGTRLALRNYQKARGLPADGFASLAVLGRINEERAKQQPR